MIPHEAHVKVRVLGHCLGHCMAYDARREVGLRILAWRRRDSATLEYGPPGTPVNFRGPPLMSASLVGGFAFASPYSRAPPVHSRACIKSGLSAGKHLLSPKLGRNPLHRPRCVRPNKGKLSGSWPPPRTIPVACSGNR